MARHPADTIPFPFEPYNVQTQLMRGVYETLDMGGVGIFESPTGTGKSLSLICSILHWLTHNELYENVSKPTRCTASSSASNNDSTSDKVAASVPDDWLLEFQEEQKQLRRAEKRHIIGTVEQRLQKLRAKTMKRRAKARRRAASAVELSPNSSSVTSSNSDDEFLLGEYHEGQRKLGNPHLSSTSSSECVSDNSSEGEDEDWLALAKEHKDDEILETQILYCSRTHSQLAQFVNEIKKTAFRNARVVALGSRRSLCINDQVLAQKSDSRMNEMCLDMAEARRKASVRASAREQRERKKLERKKEEQSKSFDDAGRNAIKFRASNKKTRTATKSGNKRKTRLSGCPYKGNGTAELSFAENVLSSVQDIEELRVTGKRIVNCPYYGTREAMPLAQVVTMPYSVLLHKRTRESVGIRLKGNVVVLDEAHNVIDAINQMHSSTLTRGHILRAHKQLSQYESRYRSRLGDKNLNYIKQILFVLKSLARYLVKQRNVTRSSVSPKDVDTPSKDSDSVEHKVLSINDFLFDVALDDLNMFKISRFIDDSHICQKLRGFCQYNEEMPPQVAASSKGSIRPETRSTTSSNYVSSPLSLVQSFLLCCINTEGDGRVVVHREPRNCADVASTSRSQKLSDSNDDLSDSDNYVRFILLNPDVHFREIVENARAVILAGGTMQPMSRVVQQLFPTISETNTQSNQQKLVQFSCGHVVPDENVICLTLPSGPSGCTLKFSFKHRTDANRIDELGRTIFNLCTIAPGGVVCFLPSYSYEAAVVNHWRKSGMMAKIQQRKKIFHEARGAGAAAVEKILQGYATACRYGTHTHAKNGQGEDASQNKVNGGLLFCVVGGKMSEGINFSDELARMVIVVGLPFANPNDPELKEKMRYLDRRSSHGNPAACSNAGAAYYEDICMNAVNQSIGRAIRHKDDFASIVLIDMRFNLERIASKLPQWLRKRFHKSESFKQAFSALVQFYKTKK